MASITPDPLSHPKSKGRGDSKQDGRENELAALQKQRNKEKSDWQNGESEIGLDKQHRQSNKGKSVCCLDVKDWLLNRLKNENQGFCK